MNSKGSLVFHASNGDGRIQCGTAAYTKDSYFISGSIIVKKHDAIALLKALAAKMDIKIEIEEPLKIGNRAKTEGSQIGTVLHIHNDGAWFLVDGADLPVTLRLKSLKRFK